MTSPADVRHRYGGDLTPTGPIAGRFSSTDPKDRQLLADAEAAGAQFIVTEDVDDYAVDDLASLDISAVNPDLFLAERLTREAYDTVIRRFVELRVNPPTTPAGFHAAISRNHPRLFAANADLYDVEPELRMHGEPAVTFRGTRCLRCEVIVTDPISAVNGLGPECAAGRADQR